MCFSPALVVASLLSFGPPEGPEGTEQSIQSEAAVTYEQAAKAYEDRDYDEAAAIFAALAEVDPSPEHFFALGQSLRFAGDCEAARKAYLRYISTGIGADQVDAIDELMSDCEEPAQPHYSGLVEVDFRSGPKPLDSDPTEAPTAEATTIDLDRRERARPGTGMWATGITLTVLGAAGFIAGVTMYTYGYNEFERANDAFVANDCDLDNLSSECSALDNRASRALPPRTAGIYTILFSPFVIGGGIALTVVGGRKRSRALVSLLHTPGGGGVSLHGRF